MGSELILRVMEKEISKQCTGDFHRPQLIPHHTPVIEQLRTTEEKDWKMKRNTGNGKMQTRESWQH